MFERIRTFFSALRKFLGLGKPSLVIKPKPKLNILFVCTGNTCRSPMAMTIARHLIEHDAVYGQVIGCIASAGMSAHDGDPATPQAQNVMLGMGMGDLSQHRAQKLTAELVDWADYVIAMTWDHSVKAVERYDNGSTKFCTLGEFSGEGKSKVVGGINIDPGDSIRWKLGDVPDPFGGNIATYTKCAKLIHWYLIKGFQNLLVEQQIQDQRMPRLQNDGEKAGFSWYIDEPRLDIVNEFPLKVAASISKNCPKCGRFMRHVRSGGCGGGVPGKFLRYSCICQKH